MTTKQGHDGDILTEIRRAFLLQRRHRGRSNRENLRNLARRACREGHSVEAVAAEAKVSEQSIRNWLRTAGKPSAEEAPVELTLVAPSVGPDMSQTRMDGGKSESVFIRFRSGAILELPLARLDAALVNALNGVAL